MGKLASRKELLDRSNFSNYSVRMTKWKVGALILAFLIGLSLKTPTASSLFWLSFQTTLAQIDPTDPQIPDFPNDPNDPNDPNNPLPPVDPTEPPPVDPSYPTPPPVDPTIPPSDRTR